MASWIGGKCNIRPFLFAITVGNSIPLSQVREDVAAAYKKEMEWQTNEMLLPFKKMCSQRKVSSFGFLWISHSVNVVSRNLIFFYFGMTGAS